MSETAPSPARPGRFYQFIARRVKWLIVALPLTCAVLLVPMESWLLELLRHFRLWCAGLAAVLVLLTAVLRLWRWLPMAALTFVWQGMPWMTYRDSEFQPPAAPPEKTFSLITCNLLYEARDPDRMIALLKEASPDVIVFEEFTPRWQGEFQSTLWPLYPHRMEAPQKGAAGICLASRLPLENAHIREDLGEFPCISAVVQAGGSRVGLLGVHPMPPMRPEGYVQWREAMLSWPAMLRELGAPHQVVTGDFNATPFCRTFHELLRSGSLRESNHGFGIASTWFPADLPAGLPLDHVLISKDLGVQDYTVGPAAGSDHRWVHVRLSVP